MQETLKKIRREELSIALIWLFHVSGIIGIVYGDALWFIQATPINLSLSFALAIYNGWSSKHFVKLGILAFSAGMITEILGVNFGWIFGDYAYGEMLGWKFLGVPWLIGANWVILVVCTGQIARDLVSSKIGQILVGVALMVLLDLLIEPMAPRLDFGNLKAGKLPCKTISVGHWWHSPYKFLCMAIMYAPKAIFSTTSTYYKFYFLQFS